MASRNGLAPHVIAYWLMSASIARLAASLISSGAAKSGKPCARLIALCLIASRVMSRMTDSVKLAAFFETGMPEPYTEFCSGVSDLALLGGEIDLLWRRLP